MLVILLFLLYSYITVLHNYPATQRIRLWCVFLLHNNMLFFTVVTPCKLRRQLHIHYNCKIGILRQPATITLIQSLAVVFQFAQTLTQQDRI